MWTKRGVITGQPVNLNIRPYAYFAVRQKSKELTTLLLDLAKVEEHRSNARGNQERWNLTQDSGQIPQNGSRGESTASLRSADRALPALPSTSNDNFNGGYDEDEALRIALQQSQRNATPSAASAAAPNTLIDLLSDENDAFHFSSVPPSQSGFVHSSSSQATLCSRGASQHALAASADLGGLWKTRTNDAPSFDFTAKDAHLRDAVPGSTHSKMFLGDAAGTHAFYPANISPAAAYYDASFVSGGAAAGHGASIAGVDPFESGIVAAMPSAKTKYALNPFADAEDVPPPLPPNPFAASPAADINTQSLVNLEPSSLVTNPYRSAQHSSSHLNPFLGANEATLDSSAAVKHNAATTQSGRCERSLFELQQMANAQNCQK